MKLEFFIGTRYLRSKKHNRFISFITIISIVGIGIGIMALITVLSVMNGFQNTIREKIIDTGFHVYVTSYGKSSIVNNYDAVIKKIKEEKIGKVVTPFFKGQVIIKSTMQRIMGIELFGVQNNLNKIDTDFKKSIRIVEGDFDLKEKNYILIGRELANFLDIKIGDRVDIISPQGGKYKMFGRVAPVMKPYIVKGIFKTGYYEYDLKLAFSSLSSLQTLFNRPKSSWGIGIKLKDIFQARRVARRIQKLFHYKYQVFTWMDLNHNLFTALKNEKTMMYLIVFLIIIVAAFNIASTLIMLIMEKKKEIGILRTMGSDASQIIGIFMINGMLMGVIGILSGIIAGVLLTLNLDSIFNFIENIVNVLSRVYYNLFSKFFDISFPERFEILARDVYYLEKLPVQIMFWDVFSICIGSMIVIFLFSFVPAKQAVKFKPMEIIRYE
ncbi:MAG: ABC transporter permease [Spirochaetes bacterium]|nr:ABC transporter permease [Spirochaetota bacterium]